MIPEFIKTDAGRVLYLPQEHRDCTVRALALVLAVPYPEAHNRLAKLGRKFGEGFDFGPVHEKLGLEMRPELCGRWFSTVYPLLKSGRFIVLTPTHAFAVLHGAIHDTRLPHGKNSVRMVYEVI